MRHILLFALLLAVVWCSASFAAAAEPAEAEPEAVEVAPIQVVGQRDTTQRITRSDLDRMNAVNLWEAMFLAPGVNLSQVGARGDSRFSIRGFDQRQIRIMLDDVPVYTPYDRNEDFARYLIDDLESIEVSKGYSSVLTGSNALGGVVNLKSARPVKEFEFKARYRNYFDSRGEDMARQATMSAGTRQDLYFLKASGAFVEQDFFRISDDFHGSPEYSYSGKLHQNQPSGKRLNSGYRDKKLNLQAGLTPTDTSEIVLTYIAQRGQKDQPPYAGKLRSSRGVLTRQWDWPYWDKDSVILSFKAEPVDGWHVKGNMYHDTYENKLRTYSDWRRLDAGRSESTYDDKAYGGRFESGYTFNDMHKLAASFSYRRDEHKRKDFNDARNESWRKTKHIKDDTYEFGLEYTLTPTDQWTLVFGGSYVSLNTPKAFDDSDKGEIMGKGNGHEAFDGQVGVFYDIAKDHQVYGTIAHKTRMPTMQERYRVSSNWDPTGGATIENLPNPGLKPEKALHLETGYRGNIANKVNVGAAIFYSEVRDLIATVKVPNPGQGDPTIDQNRNISRASFSGLELSMDFMPTDWLLFGGSFSYLDWTLHKTPASDSDSNRARYLTALPEVKATAYAQITPLEGLHLIPRFEYIAESYFDSARGTTAEPPKNDRVVLAHVKATYAITENFGIEAGVNNVFDTHYSWDEGYSMPGRTFYAGVTVEF